MIGTALTLLAGMLAGIDLVLFIMVSIQHQYVTGSTVNHEEAHPEEVHG
jgi:hypothetical protein